MKKAKELLGLLEHLGFQFSAPQTPEQLISWTNHLLEDLDEFSAAKAAQVAKELDEELIPLGCARHVPVM